LNHSSVGSIPSEREFQEFFGLRSYFFKLVRLLSLMIKNVKSATRSKLVIIEDFILINHRICRGYST
jgi:hypothetical protein